MWCVMIDSCHCYMALTGFKQTEQVRTIEAAKLTIKKRTGVAFFIRHFPVRPTCANAPPVSLFTDWVLSVQVFTDRVEAQLVDCDGLTVRRAADTAYERIVTAMFDALQQMAKMDRADASAAEDKGLLNYSIIMIGARRSAVRLSFDADHTTERRPENMYFYVSDTARQDVASLRTFQERAQRIYEENLSSYTRSVLRRSFARPIVSIPLASGTSTRWLTPCEQDFFDAVSRQLQTTAPTEIPANPSYSRAALKRAVKDAGSSKDLRKAIETLSKRVEKHFATDETEAAGSGNSNTESAVLIRVVWTACANTLEQEVRRWQDIISRCYADPSLGLEYGPSEVSAIFAKSKPL